MGPYVEVAGFGDSGSPFTTQNRVRVTKNRINRIFPCNTGILGKGLYALRLYFDLKYETV